MGDSRYYYYAADSVQLIPDPDFSLADNTTATLRLTVNPNLIAEGFDREIIEHTVENPALIGLGLVGGIWTSVNGLFILFFGGSLFFVAFGELLLPVYMFLNFNLVHR